MMKIAVFLSVIGVSLALSCTEEVVCSTFPKESVQTYCSAFLKVPCPVTCGLCASEKLKLKFTAVFDVNADAKITLEEAQNALKLLSVNMEDALVTEIKDIILDVKTAILDLYTAFDANKNSELTVNEVFVGIMNAAENIGVTIKPEMRQTLLYIADIMQIDKTSELKIPKATDIIQLVIKRIDSFPHGLLSLVRLQNMTDNNFDFERIVATQQLGYTINSKMLIWSILDKLDKDSDDFISIRELVDAILLQLEALEVKIPAKIEENIHVFLTMLENSVKTLLSKYGYKDISQLDGKTLTDLNNAKFVDQRIKIKDAVSTAKNPFPGVTVTKYMKAASNGIPQKKLTLKSIIEAAFISFDKNKDYELDLIEFSDFVLIGLPKVGAGLQDYTEALKVVKLYDTDQNDKICMGELLEMLKL